MASPQDERLKVYEELCTSYRAIDDFRARLLALLPLASGGGVFLLLNDALSKPGSLSSFVQVFAPIGYLGLVVTLGLFLYEIYGIRKCHALIEAGKQLECLLDIQPGQFRRRPRNVFYLINEPFAAGVIYPAVLAGWMFLANVRQDPRDPTKFDLMTATLGAIAVFIVGFAIALTYNLVLEGKDGDVYKFLSWRKNKWIYGFVLQILSRLIYFLTPHILGPNWDHR